MVALPNLLTNGTTADGSQVKANDDALNAAIDRIANANIVAGAAIDKDKLAQKYSTAEPWIQLVPWTANASLDPAADALFTLPQAMTAIGKWRPRLRTGQIAALVSIEWYVDEVANVGGSEVQVDCTVAGSVVGGQVIPITVSAAYYLHEFGSPVDNPMLFLQNDDEFIFRVGKAGAGGSTVRGVSARVTIKREAVQ